MFLDKIRCFIFVVFLGCFLIAAGQHPANSSTEADRFFSKAQYEQSINLYRKAIKDLNIESALQKNNDEAQNSIINKRLNTTKLKLISALMAVDLYKNKDEIIKILDELNRSWDFTWGKTLFLEGSVYYLLGDIAKSKSSWYAGVENGMQIYDEDLKWTYFNVFLNDIYFLKQNKTDIDYNKETELEKTHHFFETSKDLRLSRFYTFYFYPNKIKFDWEKEFTYGEDDDYIFIIAMKKKLKDNNLVESKEMLTRLKNIHKEKDIFYYLIDYEYNKIK